MSTTFLQKKRNIPTNMGFLTLYKTVENNLNKIYYNTSHSYIVNLNSINSNYEEKCWDKNYIPKKNIKIKIREFQTNRAFKTNSAINNKNKSLNIFKANHKDKSYNEKEYILHILKMRKYNIKQIIEINQIRSIPNKKFNLILDIDLTIIHAVESNEYKSSKKYKDIEIKGIANNNSFHYFYRYRSYLFNFIKELKNYFNFYISTLSHSEYAKQIINNFKSKANIIIPSYRINSKYDWNMNSKNYKYINELIPLSKIEEINNTVILDDNIYNWLKPENMDINHRDTIQSIKCLIPSKRYIPNSSLSEEDNDKYDILIHNNIFEEGHNKKINYFYAVDNTFCIEKDLNENNKNSQLYYIELFLKKCIKFSLFSGISLVEAMNYFRKKIFEKCKFNLKYLSKDWNYSMSLIVKDLGGNITPSINDTTHFIVENKINTNKISNKNKLQKYVNINYIFQCYFNLYKFSESDCKFN